MSHEHIQCRRCDTETSHVPPEFPREWEGLCPGCAVELMFKGELPQCSPEALMGMVDFIGVVCVGASRSPGQLIITPLGPTQYSNN